MNDAKHPVVWRDLGIGIKQIALQLRPDRRRRRRRWRRDETDEPCERRPRQTGGAQIGPDTRPVDADAVTRETSAFAFKKLLAARDVAWSSRISAQIRGGAWRKGLEIGHDHSGLLLREIERLHRRARHALPNNSCR